MRIVLKIIQHDQHNSDRIVELTRIINGIIKLIYDDPNLDPDSVDEVIQTIRSNPNSVNLNNLNSASIDRINEIIGSDDIRTIFEIIGSDDNVRISDRVIDSLSDFSGANNVHLHSPSDPDSVSGIIKLIRSDDSLGLGSLYYHNLDSEDIDRLTELILIINKNLFFILRLHQ